MGKHRPEFPDLEPQDDNRAWIEFAKDAAGVVAFFLTIWCLLVFASAL